MPVSQYSITLVNRRSRLDDAIGQYITWVSPFAELVHDPGELPDGRIGEAVSEVCGRVDWMAM